MRYRERIHAEVRATMEEVARNYTPGSFDTLLFRRLDEDLAWVLRDKNLRESSVGVACSILDKYRDDMKGSGP